MSPCFAFSPYQPQPHRTRPPSNKTKAPSVSPHCMQARSRSSSMSDDQDGAERKSAFITRCRSNSNGEEKRRGTNLIAAYTLELTTENIRRQLPPFPREKRAVSDCNTEDFNLLWKDIAFVHTHRRMSMKASRQSSQALLLYNRSNRSARWSDSFSLCASPFL